MEDNATEFSTYTFNVTVSTHKRKTISIKIPTSELSRCKNQAQELKFIEKVASLTLSSVETNGLPYGRSLAESCWKDTEEVEWYPDGYTILVSDVNKTDDIEDTNITVFNVY